MNTSTIDRRIFLSIIDNNLRLRTHGGYPTKKSIVPFVASLVFLWMLMFVLVLSVSLQAEEGSREAAQINRKAYRVFQERNFDAALSFVEKALDLVDAAIVEHGEAEALFDW